MGVWRYLEAGALSTVPTLFYLVKLKYNADSVGDRKGRRKSMISRVTAGLLALFLGGFGAHKFYLGKTWWGIAYLVFIWTYIPAIVSFIEGLMYLFSSDADFQRKYCKSETSSTNHVNSSSNSNIRRGGSLGSMKINKNL